MKTKRKLNVRLLRKIQRHILEEPRRFFMEGVVVKAKNQDEWTAKTKFEFDDTSKQIPPCGTAACIAGWAILLSGKRMPKSQQLISAAKLLHIDYLDPDSLFLSSEWPKKFADRYEKAKTPKQRAKIACARIEHLIETGE